MAKKAAKKEIVTEKDEYLNRNVINFDNMTAE